MRLTTSLLAAAATAAGLSAQTNPEYDLYSGTTSYTSRHALAGTDEGWVTMNYSARHHSGSAQVDDPAGLSVSAVEAIRYLLQDQGGTTQEPYSVGIFSEDAANPGQPDANVDPMTMRPVPDVLLGPFNTPTTTNTAAVAWIFTSAAFTPPYNALAMEADNFFGILLPPNAGWPTTDGVSIHGSWYTASANGDNPSQGALTGGAMGGSLIYDTVHGINITAGNTVAPAPNDRQARIWYRAAAGTLKVGADISGNTRSTINPNYGIGGIYPDHALRGDGLAYNVKDINYDHTTGTAQAFVIMQFGGLFNNGFKVLGGAGMQWIDVTNTFFAWGPLTPAADVNTWEQIVLPAGSIPMAPLGDVTSQGLLIDLTAPDLRPTLTNAVKFESL